MYIDDKLIEWVKATDDIHADFVKNEKVGHSLLPKGLKHQLIDESFN